MWPGTQQSPVNHNGPMGLAVRANILQFKTLGHLEVQLDARKSGKPNWKRFPICWWWETGIWKRAPSLSATARRETWAR